MSKKNENEPGLSLEFKLGSGNAPVTDEIALVENTKEYTAPQTVITLPEPKYLTMTSNPATAKAVQSEPVHNDGGVVIPMPANVIPNGRGRNILKARADKPVKNV